jgi:hypothetical protein
VWADASRKTWLPLVPAGIDVRYFIGNGTPAYVSTDQIQLNCDDSYGGLPAKVQGIVKWASAQDYDYVLKLDDDVVIDPVHMLASEYANNPYVGADGHRPTPQRAYFIPSGFAYWMNKQCMEIVAAATLPNNGFDEGWVAGLLHAQGIDLTCDPRYYINVPQSKVLNRAVPNGRVDTRIRRQAPQGTFAWCIYFEPTTGTKYTIDQKIAEFNRVFAVEVAAKKQTEGVRLP